MLQTSLPYLPLWTYPPAIQIKKHLDYFNWTVTFKTLPSVLQNPKKNVAPLLCFVYEMLSMKLDEEFKILFVKHKCTKSILVISVKRYKKVWARNFKAHVPFEKLVISICVCVLLRLHRNKSKTQVMSSGVSRSSASGQPPGHLHSLIDFH